MSQPNWLSEAWREFGQSEISGPRDNPRIMAFYSDSGFANIAHDETAWCAAFVGACLKRSQLESSGSLMARSYLRWGSALQSGLPGAVAVFSRGNDPVLGHVGFWLGETAQSIAVLGGNQTDAVTVIAVPKARLLGLRWPVDHLEQSEVVAKPVQDAGHFKVALAHVLKMEGGYSDDAFDPGGPTNKGITLKEYADWTQTTLDASNAAELKYRLRTISDAVVSEIYWSRYWGPSHAAELPGSIALMHFDTAVNQGTGTATRILQEAIGVAADGEFGPLTRAAAARADPIRILNAYAALRRNRYRRLSTFWRFGRGWLRRVDATLAKARALHLDDVKTPKEGSHTMKEQSVSPSLTEIAEPKWWGQSMTIWGAMIAAAASVIPALGPVIGVTLTPEIIQQLGEAVPAALQAVVALTGTLMTIYGRVRARQPLERRQVSLML